MAAEVKQTGRKPRVGDGTPGPGRPVGSKNRATKVREKALAEGGGLLPLTYLLGIVRDEGQKQETRMDAAKAAAPYCHPKLTSAEVKHSGQIDFRKLLTELE